MYHKKDIIFSSGIGVCIVADIINLSVDKNLPVQYYQLISVHDQKKISYIPTEQHHVQLRPLITVEEAKEKKKIEELSPKELQEVEYVLKSVEKSQNMGGKLTKYE